MLTCLIVVSIFLILVCLVMANHMGYMRGCEQATTHRTHCSADRFFDDWDEKNRRILRLEKRVFQLKRANRNLRAEVRGSFFGPTPKNDPTEDRHESNDTP